ncbi:MAG TPA: CDP-alcohol phosphatidyltransferase family protein [Candidatus Bathyarchaeia archaeon]|nr:CDP-alcohol phosphatidyltransferase family protein [Candidatus Bathyarchaeia archaeon]
MPDKPFQSATRVQVSLITSAEKNALAFFAAHMPSWVTSDQLTVLGFAAQIMVGVSYALSRNNLQWLLWGILFLILNWFGDSLDGTLARFRNRQRPRYGFYVDHVIDAIGTTALCVGLGFSALMSPLIAAALLVAFLLLAIEVYLATYTIGKFNLAFFYFGPTELRILLALGNLAVFLRGPYSHIAGHNFLLFDIGAVCGIVGMCLILLYAAIRHTKLLYDEERLP